MADSLIAKKLKEVLNEEKWTRATLSGYTVNQIKELDALYQEAFTENALNDLDEICEDHISHSKNSIAALYLSGLSALARGNVDDSNMVSLINIFADNRKWNIVQYICERILDFGENKNALVRLAECYENSNDEEKKYETWEKLVRIDLDEADIVKSIAEKKERDNNLEGAIEYYRKALLRYVNKKLFSNVKEIWNKLIELAPQDVDFFNHVQRKIAKSITDDKEASEGKAASLLMDLYKYYKDKGDWDVAIPLIKTIIDYDDKNSSLRKEIVECFKEKYKKHSRVDEYIRLSNLSQSYRSIHEAIADFEKHIAFDVGNFVYHRTWNIGKIKSIKDDEIVIDFAKKRDHKMALKMAVDSLITLQREHIWVQKAIKSKDKLHDDIKNDIPKALKMLIRSFDNHTDLKRIKAELVPSVLTASEWTSWSTKARDILKTDPSFGNAPESVNVYIVRDRPLSFEEKIYNQFKAEKNFASRIQPLREFAEKGDTDSEFFNEMINFFVGFINVKSASQTTEYVASYLLLKELAVSNPSIGNMFHLNFVDLYNECSDIVNVYLDIKDSKLKEALLKNIKNYIPEWASVYVRIFPHALSKPMIETLRNAGESEKIQNMVISIIENYRDYREAFIWIAKNMWDDVEAQVSISKVLITLIHILDISFREIDNHRNSTDNKRINKQVENILFKDGQLYTYIENANIDEIDRILALIMDVKDLDSGIVSDIRKHVSKTHPDYKFAKTTVETTQIAHYLMVTEAKFKEKSDLLQHIKTIDIPANQKETAFALGLGDLRENAEYKAAKEKQNELNNKVTKLTSEIDRARIYDPSTVNTDIISFGTDVILTNLDTNEEEHYIILGPWESNPDKDIISYQSPLGKRILNHKVGEELSFEHDKKTRKYAVKNIKAAEI